MSKRENLEKRPALAGLETLLAWLRYKSRLFHIKGNIYSTAGADRGLLCNGKMGSQSWQEVESKQEYLSKCTYYLLKDLRHELFAHWFDSVSQNGLPYKGAKQGNILNALCSCYLFNDAHKSCAHHFRIVWQTCLACRACLKNSCSSWEWQEWFVRQLPT